MKVTKTVNPSFGNLFHGSTLSYRISKQLLTNDNKNTYSQIIEYISKNKLDKKRFIDIKLDINYKDNFYAVMFPKKHEVPNHPDTVHPIKTTKKGLLTFKKWVNNWNSDYSPKFLKKWDEYNFGLNKHIKEFLNTEKGKALDTKLKKHLDNKI